MIYPMDTLKQRDAILAELWQEFADIPMNPDTECIEENFLDFPAGTPRGDIWRWFDERHSQGVARLLYGDGVDRTPEFAKLAARYAMCVECDAEHCLFNPEGLCLAPMVYGREPEPAFDGCSDYAWKEWMR